MIFSACLPKLPCHTTSVATSLTTSHYISPLKTACRTQKKQSGEPKGNFPTPILRPKLCVYNSSVLRNPRGSVRAGQTTRMQDYECWSHLHPFPISHQNFMRMPSLLCAFRRQLPLRPAPHKDAKCISLGQSSRWENNDQRTLGK